MRLFPPCLLCAACAGAAFSLSWVGPAADPAGSPVASKRRWGFLTMALPFAELIGRRSGVNVRTRLSGATIARLPPAPPSPEHPAPVPAPRRARLALERVLCAGDCAVMGQDTESRCSVVMRTCPKAPGLCQLVHKQPARRRRVIRGHPATRAPVALASSLSPAAD